MRRDPHGYWWMLALIFTPVGWCLAFAFRAWKVAADIARDLRGWAR